MKHARKNALRTGRQRFGQEFSEKACELHNSP
jgi:hypothetical protein